MCVREKVRVRVPLDDVLSRTGFHIHCHEAFSSSRSIEIFRCIIFRRIIDACVLTCVRACVCRSQDCGNSTYANSTRRTSCLSSARHDSVRTTSGALMSIVRIEEQAAGKKPWRRKLSFSLPAHTCIPHHTLCHMSHHLLSYVTPVSHITRTCMHVRTVSVHLHTPLQYTYTHPCSTPTHTLAPRSKTPRSATPQKI